MKYGKTIGKKFYEDGKIRRYPGNTVVARVRSDSPAYSAMAALYGMVKEAQLDDHIILMPHDSYHMTVIRGVNDQVRTDAYWPESLPKDTPMEQMDNYISEAVGRVKMPARVQMKFDRIDFSTTCMKVLLLPDNEADAKALKEFRDGVAKEIGLALPGHDEYRFHITLGYTRIIPEGENAVRMDRMIQKMDAFIAEQEPFEISDPYMAFYDDMLEFSPVRIPR